MNLTTKKAADHSQPLLIVDEKTVFNLKCYNSWLFDSEQYNLATGIISIVTKLLNFDLAIVMKSLKFGECWIKTLPETSL